MAHAPGKVLISDMEAALFRESLTGCLVQISAEGTQLKCEADVF